MVRVSGPLVSQFLGSITSGAIRPRVATLTPFHDATGEILDKGIVLYFQGPGSYTGQDLLELQGHGGPVVLQRVLQRCLELGARVAEPGEFTRRAYLNGKLDLAQAEAVIDLINASTDQAARCALRTVSGEYSFKIHGIAKSFINLRSLTEATLDFPEEDIDVLTWQRQEAQLTTIEKDLKGLLAASKQGSLLSEGIRVVIAGQPNVGKSSLLNRLAGQDVAIVTEIPGTTRDLIRQSINLEGLPAHFIDTAGLRETSDPVERIGIGRAWEVLSQADAVLMMMDAQRGETDADRIILSRLPSGVPLIRVWNKSDLVHVTSRLTQQQGAGVVWLSAKTGEGVDVLRQVLKQAVGWEGYTEGVFMAHTRHLEAMRRTQEHLGAARMEIRNQELFAEELRLAHEALMSITGEVTPDDLLGEIFARFCIGK